MGIKQKIFEQAVNNVVASKTLRGIAVKRLDKMIYKNIIASDGIRALPKEREQRYGYITGIMHQVRRNLDKGYIKPEVTRKMVNVFTGGSLKTDRNRKLNPVQEAYKEKHGDFPPLFPVLSPTKACNLKCEGCYATSDPHSSPKMKYETTSRIVKETRDVLGSKFITISGGEPFMYRDGEKTMFDIFEEYNDMFFLVYTNGTLITEKVAKRLAELGNVTPCISIEGFEEHTDARRGKGVHKKILAAMENLRNAGVPFGSSITATSKNIDVLMKDEFYDYYFNELGVSYVFQFQIMPVGRGKEVIDLMITPQQRVNLYHLWTKLLMEKRYPLADFWNSGSLTDGCLAYGRWAGYFYINWDGKVMPCVFVPFHKDNINDLYAEGKDLGDALQSDFFKRGRKWQKHHGFGDPENKKNVLMPCSIKDHFDNFKENILTDDAIGENPDANAMRSDPEFAEVLRKYDEELEKLTRVVFEEEYLEKQIMEAE